jgi:hypothetical protein
MLRFLDAKKVTTTHSKMLDAAQYFLNKGGDQLCNLFNPAFVREHSTLLESCDLIVGLHPDQATDFIVECGLQLKKPFACVPCCVYPSTFSHRRLQNGSDVRTREDLCQYLREKHPDILGVCVSEIPGPCNDVVWWTGPTERK